MKRKNLYKILGVAIFIEDLLRNFCWICQKMIKILKFWEKDKKTLGKAEKTQQIQKKTRCTDGKGPGWSIQKVHKKNPWCRFSWLKIGSAAIQ